MVGDDRDGIVEPRDLAQHQVGRWTPTYDLKHYFWERMTGRVGFGRLEKPL
jgi:hypothetical protein